MKSRSVLLKCLSLAFIAFFLSSSSNANVWIAEFVADNDGSLLDEDGDAEDWIEIHNDSELPIEISGWSLTDDPLDLKKWVFPAGTSIPADAYLLVFASGKNRRLLDEPLHSNFSLSKGGEYLALVHADGTSIQHAYAPAYPPQFEGLSYGLEQSGERSTLITLGASGQAGVPSSASDFSLNYSNWNSAKTSTFNGPTWQSVSTGVGYERDAGYGVWLGADLESAMYGLNPSVFLRVPFVIENASAVSSLILQMKWDDGFEAFINGVRVAGNRDPEISSWNALSTSNRLDEENNDWSSFSIPADTLGLVDGTNILAIQGFNQSATSSDMLLLPELDSIANLNTVTAPSYQLSPSPRQANGPGTVEVPPFFVNATDRADRPLGGVGSAPIRISAEVRQTVHSLDTVRLYYRTMFGSESQSTMRDDGLGDDLVAGDMIFSASIPTSGLNPGQMIRWRIEAADIEGHVATSPRYEDPIDADRYYGTVAINPAHQSSQLTILETFVSNQAAINSWAGSRASVYYLGQFYDNILMDLHGQSTSDFPKKSYDLDFNKGNRFLWSEGEARVKDINLLTNWADKSRVRNTMGYAFYQACGAAYHFAFPVRVEQNGAFFSIADMVEDGDDRYLERIGLDGRGALYKMYDPMVNPAYSAKKTRKEEGTQDLAALIAGLSESLPRDLRRHYAYDHVDLAATVNYLATNVVGGISDTGHKNFYLYRDTEGSGEWRPLPWDVDLSAGRLWGPNSTYFDDNLYWNLWTEDINRLWELIFNTPEYQAMFVRRVRSLREQVLGAPGISADWDWYSLRIQALIDQIDPLGIVSDAELDYEKWGSWGNQNDTRTAGARILEEWLPQQRYFLFSSARNLNGVPIPSAQAALPNVTIENIDFLPSSGNQDEEYLVLKNRDSSAVDISNWSLSGAVDFVFPAGTVIPAGTGTVGANYVGLLHVARRAEAFRARADAVSGGQFRFVQGNFNGQLSARGETLELRTDTGALVSSRSYAGTPSPAQEYLRITEVMYNPLPDTGITSNAQDLEYIELRNISDSVALDLTGVQFTQGVLFDFTGSAVTSLGPGDRVLVVANQAMFMQRYGNALPVAGAFYGSLDNSGESIRLGDSVGEKILDFAYRDHWFPITDGLGFSLVVLDETVPWNAWGEPSNWRISGARNGSPASAVSATAFPSVLVNEVLAHTDLPLVDSIELWNPSSSSADLSGWFLTDEFSEPHKYRIPAGTIIPPGGYIVFNESDFNSGAAPFLLSEHGESAYLFSADASSLLTGYVHGWDFGASPNGVSFGRYLNSLGVVHFVLQSARSLNAPNAPPRVGPVVISEIHYHPPDHGSGIDNTADEFIELYNTSATEVPLFSTDTSIAGYGDAALQDTWRLRNAVDFDFPIATTLAPGERILVVSFDPAGDPAQLANFRARFQIPTDIAIFGPWDGKLDNSGEQIELKQPGSAEPIEPYVVPYLIVEEINYRDESPWPESADGFALSLQRRAAIEFGNDPINWRAAYPQGAAPPDSDNDGIADWWETFHGLTVGINDSALDPDHDGLNNAQEAEAGTNPWDGASLLHMNIGANSQGITLGFLAVADVRYTIQFTNDLNTNAWQTWQQIEAQPSDTAITLSDSSPDAFFFRVVTPPVQE